METSIPTKLTTIKPGMIFSHSWGYDQTNVDAYQVVKATAKTVWMRKIKTYEVSTGDMTADVWPIRGDFAKKEIERHKIQYGPYGLYLSMGNYSGAGVAKPWEGNRLASTSYA